MKRILVIEDEPQMRLGLRDGDVGHAGFRALAGQQVGIAAAGGQAHHLEAVRVGGDHLERLGADRTGAAQHQDAETVSCCAHCPIVRQPGPSPESLLPQSPNAGRNDANVTRSHRTHP